MYGPFILYNAFLIRKELFCRFYYMRQSYPAAIARLNSLVNRYPLYSHVDEALYLLGQAYEGEIAIVRSKPVVETQKANMITDLTRRASDAYSKILTRYPLMDRVEDAKKRLEALHQPIPNATPAAIALNKAEQDSRHSTGMVSHVLSSFKKHPEVAKATRVGEPPLVDPPPTSATWVVKQVSIAGAGGGSLAAEIKAGGAPPPNEAPPRSDTAPVRNAGAPAAAPDPNELKPDAPAGAPTPPDANELKVDSSANGGQALPPPPQVNEIQTDSAAPPAGSSSSSNGAPATSSTSANTANQGSTSSSKPKKKKGLHKIIPF